MNYKKIYDQIIERANNRVLNGYKEKHHIIPRCLGGGDEKSNIAELTAREHFLCHWLLHEIYPEDKKLLWAFNMMCTVKDRNQMRYTPSSRIVEYAKIKYANSLIGTKQSEEAKEKNRISNSGVNNPFFGKKHSEETKSKMRKSKPSLLGERNPSKKEEVRKKISSKNLGRKLQNITGKNHPFSKRILQFDLNGNFIKEWESMNLAANATNVQHSGIRACCKGRYKQCKGYIWKYKNED